MRNKVVIIGAIAIVAYLFGSQARKNKHYEDLRHQVERLWTDPKAKKSRAKKREQLAKRSRHIAKETAKTLRAKTAH